MTISKRMLGLYMAFFALCLYIHPSALAQDNGSAGEPIVSSIDPSKLVYDILVDGSLPQDDPANNKYRTLQAAYAAAPAGTPTRQTVIGIMPNVYQITGTLTTPGLTITKNYITLLGLTNDRRKVVLADNRGNEQGAGTPTDTNDGYVMVVNATGFTAENLTILNYCNVNYEYPGDPSKNLTARSNVITQAVALQASGDKHTYINVALLSRLDTMFLQTTRSYFQNVYLEGTDDFLGGGTISVFQDSEIYFPTGSGVMSASGVTFINTKFSATNGMEFYKGASNPVTLIDCVVPVDTPKAHVAWIVTGFPVTTRPNLYSLTYHVKDTNGNPAVIVDQSSGTPTFNLSRELTDQEAAAFNPWNLLRATPTGVADNWDPANAQATYEGLGEGSLVYRMALSNGNPTIFTGQAGATISASVSPTRAPDTTVTWSTSSPLVSLSTSGNSVTVTGQNNTLQAQYVPINAKAANGFYVTAWVLVQPQFIDPPAPIAGPFLSAPAGGFVNVSYSIRLNGLQDQSLVSWFICDDETGSNARPIAVSRGNVPFKSLPLTLGDVGKYIEVSIQPKSNISNPGPALTAIATAPIRYSDVKVPTVSPDFTNFPTNQNSTYVSGLWTVLKNWTSSTGASLVNGYGLRVASQGASLLYQQDQPVGDMQIDLVMSPEKTAGQGFGSPGSGSDVTGTQNSDIFIKYDPRTKTGYSLRYWRTTQSATDCMFQLYQINNGIGTPIGDGVLTGVFKPNTFMTLRIIGSTFTVTAHNDTDSDTLSLSGTIAPNTFGGGGVYWDGTVPTGNSNVYSMIRISYPGTIQLATSAKLTKLSNGEYQAEVTVRNNGTGTAQNVELESASLGSVNGISAPVYLGNLLSGASATTTITYPASAGASGAASAEKYSGTYTGGTFTGNIRASLP